MPPFSAAVASTLPAATSGAPSVAVPVAELLDVIREYIEASRFDAAERLLGHVRAAMPRHSEALHLLGFIAFRRNRFEAAAALMEQGIATGGATARQLSSLAEVYRVLGRLDEGLAIVRRAAALGPTDPVCHFNESMLEYERMDIGACIRAARRALQLKPDMPEAHMRLAQALLIQGDFAEGWAEYEWRYQIAGAQPLMPPALAALPDRPQWDGAPLNDRTLLLIADQGYGDVFMFMRYIPWAARRCGDIIIACSIEVQPILQRTFPSIRMFTRWDELPPYAAFCAFSGLPRLHGTRLDSIPGGVPYLQPDPARLAHWRARLDQLVPHGLRRVAIAWAGRPTHNNDRNRTVDLPVFAPLGEVPGIALLSLQKGPAASQIAGWAGPAPLINLDPELETFEDTAAVVGNIDLQVTVDTAVVHLAGAMGRPAWVMIPRAPDWRWLIDRADTPWYPDMRLFRPTQARDWAPVVRTIAEELRRALG